ncbi:MAG: 50S ribosomal protein L24 [Chitinophagales bacterium]|nr:50S ribosomal protein L24 [Chitinophagales bacterium]
MKKTSNNKRFTPKSKIKKGDTVVVISGSYKGKEAKVLEVYPKTNKALVEGINIVKKHTKPNAQNQQGGIVEAEAPINISNLMVVVGGQATRIGRQVDENGKIVRIAKKTGEVVK